MMGKRGVAFFFCMLFGMSLSHCCGQQVRFDNLKEQFNKKNIFRIGGGLAANTVFYAGNNEARQSYMWVLSGNVNLSLFNQINLPFSCNLNNLGRNYSYPTLPNRLSLHPSYKWIYMHVGDVSMNFSPYTLNGHQFTGAGVEFRPEGCPLRVAVMYGRLLKATEYDSLARFALPAYKRVGYGVKLGLEREAGTIAMTLFSARDARNSLKWIPDSLAVYPRSNLAMSWEAVVKPFEELTLRMEAGVSWLTRDLRMKSGGTTFFGHWYDKNTSTARYYAVKADIAYQFKKNAFGFGYERVAPGYETLGAYYFTNDLENFTVSYARPFFSDKLTMALSGGMQHDDLDRNKQEQTNRWVAAAELVFAPMEKLNMAFSFSSFQSYTHIRSQFEEINETTPYDNLDTLDFTQLSQNLNLNITYAFGNDKTYSHHVNMNFSYQEAADKRGNVIHPGSASCFYNLAAVYGLMLVPAGIQFTASANASYNTVGISRMLTCGPALSLSARFFKKKIPSGLSFAFNSGFDSGDWINSVMNVRWNAGWNFAKKHNAGLVVAYQTRNVVLKQSVADFTSTLNYSYNF